MPWTFGSASKPRFRAFALDQVAAVEHRGQPYRSVPVCLPYCRWTCPLVVRLMSLVRRPQQVQQRADASGPAEIMDDVEGPADGVAAEPAERGEGAKLGVDVVPGDAKLARTLGGVDRAGEAAPVAKRDRHGGTLAVALGIDRVGNFGRGRVGPACSISTPSRRHTRSH